MGVKMSNNRYDISENSLRKINAKLLYVSISKYGSDWASTPHTHNFTEIFYVLRGKGRFMVDGHTFNVKENDFVVVNPSVEHTEYSVDSTPLEYAVVGIDGTTFSQDKSENSKSYKVYNYPSYREEFLFYLKMIVRETKSNEPYNQEICNNIFELLIITMIRKGDFIISSPTKQSHNKECGKIKRYIDSNFHQSITLDDLVGVTHLNKFYLVHSFKKNYGTSPINYLIEKRIAESRHLLESTNNSVSVISNAVGFSSPAYFSQIFKKTTGISPMDYRRKKKE